MAPRIVAVLVVCLAVFSMAAAHGLLTNPVPRSGTSQTAKSACTASAGPIAATYAAGTTVTMTWDIIACHCPGTVTWSISYSGDPANFEALGPSTATTAAGSASAQIALPAGKTCESCLLRWNWQGTEASPYIGCADIKITGADNRSVFCKSGLVACSSASAVSFSALLVLLALLAMFF